MTDYTVALDVYNGPLDLLLFLIRREEIDIYDIPIARITGQYVQYVEVLRQVDPESVSEFLVLAATLMEIKSRTLLPRPPADEVDEEIVDPRFELVRQLLEYKTYKDVARSLEESAQERACKHERSPALPDEPEEGTELENLDIWDLFDAFNRLLEETGQRAAVHEIGVDDTPVALHAEDIVDSIERAGGKQEFKEIFTGRSRPEMIGLFLALLELIRQQRVRVTQDRPFGAILIILLDPTPLDVVVDEDANETAGEAPDPEEASAAASDSVAPADAHDEVPTEPADDAPTESVDYAPEEPVDAAPAEETTERVEENLDDRGQPSAVVEETHAAAADASSSPSADENEIQEERDAPQ